MLQLVFEFCEALNNFLAFGFFGFIADGTDGAVDVVDGTRLGCSD
jgi:hypothetical protein